MGYFCSPQAFDSQVTFRPLKNRLGFRVKENESGIRASRCEQNKETGSKNHTLRHGCKNETEDDDQQDMASTFDVRLKKTGRKINHCGNESKARPAKRQHTRKIIRQILEHADQRRTDKAEAHRNNNDP